MDALVSGPAGEAGSPWIVGRRGQLLPPPSRLRRAIHAEPELGLDLPKTTAKVKAALAGLPLEIREGPSTSGLVAMLRGPANGRTVLLRGDMDALPLIEDTGLDFASRHAGRHARLRPRHPCRHAGRRRAGALRAARALAGSVMFMFQPGEEGWHGARLHDRGRPARPAARRRLRPAHLAQHAGGRVRRPRRAAAGLVRQAAHQGDRPRRPRLHAARRPRSDADRLRDRHRPADAWSRGGSPSSIRR